MPHYSPVLFTLFSCAFHIIYCIPSVLVTLYSLHLSLLLFLLSLSQPRTIFLFPLCPSQPRGMGSGPPEFFTHSFFAHSLFTHYILLFRLLFLLFAHYISPLSPVICTLFSCAHYFLLFSLGFGLALKYIVKVEAVGF